MTPLNIKTKDEKVSKAGIALIDPMSEGKCPECGGTVRVMMGIVVCKDCKFRKDLYK